MEMTTSTVDGSEIPNNHLGCKDLVKTGISYQPQLVSRRISFSINRMTAIAWASSTESHKTPGNHVDAQEDVTFCIHKQMTTKTSDIVDIGTRFGGCKWNNKRRADRRMIFRAI